VAGAVSWDRAGPLWRAKFPPDGFVTYRDLCGLNGDALSALIAETVAYFAADPAIEAFEGRRADTISLRISKRGSSTLGSSQKSRRQ